MSSSLRVAFRRLWRRQGWVETWVGLTVALLAVTSLDLGHGHGLLPGAARPASGAVATDASNDDVTPEAGGALCAACLLQRTRRITLPAVPALAPLAEAGSIAPAPGSPVVALEHLALPRLRGPPLL